MFGNLCEQLMTVHGLGGQLPHEARRRRALFSQLLQLETPPGKRLLVLIDGLDEALGRWKPEADIFPEPPEGTQVVFSARDIADKDWLKFLKLDLPAECVIRVGPLDNAGVAEIVQSARPEGWKNGELGSLADQVWSVSRGDPFYVQDLVSDLKPGVVVPSELRRISHSEYLNLWWQGAAVSNPAFVDLMGLLAALLGPMTKDELANIDETDQLRDINISELIESAARYLIGNDTDGYQLSHARIQQFVSLKIGSELKKYQTRITDYCLRWASLDQHSCIYIWRHAAKHLTAAGQYEKLFALIDAPWLAAKWQNFGSYAAVISDLDACANSALARTPPDVARISALGVARATAREIMARFPTSILAALIRLGYGRRVIDLVGAERIIERLPEQLLFIAAELAARLAAVDEAEAARYLDFIVEAIATATESAARQLQLELLEKAATLLGDLPGPKALQFVERMLARLDAVQDPVFTCVALCRFAIAIADLPGCKASFANLSERGELLLTDIPQGGGKLAAASYVLATKAKMQSPPSLLDAAKTCLSSAGDYFRPWRWIDEPIAIFVRTFPFESIRHEPGALELLDEIIQRVLNVKIGSPKLAGAVGAAFLRLGQPDRALDFIRELQQRRPEAAPHAKFLIANTLHAADPEACRDLIEQSTLPPAQLSIAWARVGDWARALDAAETALSSRNGSGNGPPLILSLLSLLIEKRPAGLNDLVNRLLLLSTSFSPLHRAEIRGTAATALAPVDQTAAIGFLQEATALQFAAFPIGDTDQLREFLAIAFHQEAKYPEAARVVGQIKLEDIRASTLSKLVQITPASDATALQLYATAITAFLAGQGAAASFDALRTAISLLTPLTEKAPEAVGSLRAHVETNGRKILDVMSSVFRGFARDPEGLQRLGWPDFSNLVTLASQLFLVAPDKAGAVLTDVWSLAFAQPPPIAGLIHILFAQAVPVPAILVSYAPAIEQALNNARESHSDPWIATVTELAGPAIVQLATTDPLTGRALMSSLLNTILSIENPMVLCSAMSKYWWHLGNFQQFSDLVESALTATLRLSESEGRLDVFSAAAQVLFLQGGRPAAEALFSGISEPQDREYAEGMLKPAEDLKMLGDLSPLEQLYTSRGSHFPILMLTDVRSGNAANPLKTFTRALAEDLLIGNRRAVLDAGIWTLLLPVCNTFGATAVEAIIDSIDDFDRRFLDAAKLLIDPSRAAGATSLYPSQLG